MKTMKKLLIGLVILLAVLCLVSYFYLQTFKPNYSKNINLNLLNAEVEAYYDVYGIPHVYAQSKPDAFRAFGYIHAKDRLWQMELLRRIAPGRLSEIFGKDLLEIDKFFRMVDIEDYSLQSLEHFRNELDPQIRQNVLAYLDGINQYIDRGKAPIGYKILGLKITPFSPLDIYNIIGYMSFSFAVAHETDPVLTFILDEHGPEYLKDLMVHVDSSTTMIKSGIGHQGLEDLSIHVSKLTKSLPVPKFIGSNSWVIGGDKTRSGKVLFANDPHIGYASPSVWFEAHLNAPDFEIYGYFIGGYPFPHLMHNDNHAIGLTMFENDDIDFFAVQENPDNDNQYLYKGEWKEYEKREETIRIKGGQEEKISVRSTVHGPVVNDVVPAIDSDTPISMWWTYVLHKNQSIEGSYGLLTAKNINEARAAAALIHAPGLNIMYGDAKGNVAWWASAKLVKRPDHVNSKLILDGSSGEDDPLGYFEFSENPMAENPDWNYVYSANNQPVAEGYALYPGYYLPEDRARRIVKLLEAKDDWTVEDVQKMITDVTSENSPEIAKTIAVVLEGRDLSALEKTAVDLLKNWDGKYSLESKAPLVYNKMVYHISHFGMMDELGEELFEVYNGNHTMKRSIQTLFASENSPWWDDVHTSEVRESRKDIFIKALRITAEELSTQFGTDTEKWKWGNAHTLEHNHSFSAVPALKKYFNIGPFPVPGNCETINNYMFSWEADGTYEVVAGPSTRRIIDFADIAGNSWSILPTGQSGNVMSPHYKDQAEMHSKGEFRRMLMDREEIVNGARNKTVFRVGD